MIAVNSQQTFVLQLNKECNLKSTKKGLQLEPI